MCSPICVPGVAVGIVLNVPRVSLGPSGLGSQVSRWLIPPQANRMIHDFALPDGLGLFLSELAKLWNFLWAILAGWHKYHSAMLYIFLCTVDIRCSCI